MKIKNLLRVAAAVSIFFCFTNNAFAVDVSTFEELNNAFENGGEINISNDIKFENSNTNIKENLIINGNNFTFDGDNNSTLTIKEDKTVTIKNIKITNFNNNKDSYGTTGFILNNGNIEEISGEFINNKNVGEGAAIKNEYKGFINKIDGKFINNRSGDGAISNRGNINEINGYFENNHADEDGGAIWFFDYEKTTNSISGTFINNSSVRSGGAIAGESIINNINAVFENNYTEGSGGAIASAMTINNLQGTFTNNHADGGGGAILNGLIYKGPMGTINNLSGTFKNNTAGYTGGAILNYMGFLNIVSDDENTIFSGNKANNISNALTNINALMNLNANSERSIIINDGIGINLDEYINAYKQNNQNYTENDILEQITFFNNTFKKESAVININPKVGTDFSESVKYMFFEIYGISEEEYEKMSENEKTEINNIISEINSSINVPEYTSGTVEINNKVKNQTVNMFDGTLKLGTNVQDNVEYSGTFDSDVNFNYFGGKVTLQNNGINHANFGNMTLNSEMDLSLDADLANEKMDTISADKFTSNDNKINISNINLISGAKKSLSLSPLSNDMDSTTRQTMAEAIIYSGGDVAYGNIYKYTVEYDKTNAMLNFGLQSTGGNNLSDYAPAVAAKPIAQSGAQSVQTDSYTESFRNMDMFMLLKENERLAYKYQNKYASSNGDLVYDPTMTPYSNSTAWFRPYTTFENIPLKNGPKINNIKYGTYFGYDSALKELGNGWDGTLGVYAGYNGSHQTFNGNSVYQNGGTLGLVGVAYKGNFFTGLTANIGATAGSAQTLQGTDNFTALMGGISSKTGYNFEFAEGKVILQPSMLMSYSLINTFDYTTSTGVKLKSDPLHTIQLEPSLKVIGNIGTWQPYANVSMVWNLLNETKVTADDVALPEVSIKPYVKYGVGVQKKWGDKFTGFGQCYVTNGGRNGVGLQAGLRIALGDVSSSSKSKKLTPDKKQTVIELDD